MGDSLEDNPRYLQQTFASSVIESSLAESDKIRASFRTGSWSSIKKLPAKLEAGAIQFSRKQEITENRLRKPDSIQKFRTVKDFFRPLVYQFSDFDSEREKNKNDSKFIYIYHFSHSFHPRNQNQ